MNKDKNKNNGGVPHPVAGNAYDITLHMEFADDDHTRSKAGGDFHKNGRLLSEEDIDALPRVERDMVGAQLSAMVNSFTDRFCPELMAEMAVMYEGGWRPGFRAPKEGVRS